MVIKGGARGFASNLATHLLRTDHNETVNVLAICGTDAPDLRTALLEMDAIGAGTRTKRTLYHANIDARADERLTPEQQGIAVARLGDRLGFDGQPFVLVEHVKHGRHHLHVVWSRIDLLEMKAIPDSHNYRKHEEVARDLEREFGHERVQGVHHEKNGTQRPTRTPDYGEMMQAARSGITLQEARAVVTNCWNETSTGKDFVERLTAAGFIVARGDRRDFVLLDPAGEVHGLTRRIEGVKAAEVRQRMSDVNRDELPEVKEARERLQREASRPALQPEKSPEFESAIDRLRKEEARTRATELGSTNGEIADAIYHLNKTMRGQVEMTITTASAVEQERIKSLVKDAAAQMARTAQENTRDTPAIQQTRINSREAEKSLTASTASAKVTAMNATNQPSRPTGKQLPQQSKPQAQAPARPYESLLDVAKRKTAERLEQQQRDGVKQLARENRKPRRQGFQRERDFS